MSDIASESFGNIRTVKAFSNEHEEIRKFAIGNQNVYKYGISKALQTAGFSLSCQLFLYVAMIVVIYVASLLY